MSETEAVSELKDVREKLQSLNERLLELEQILEIEDDYTFRISARAYKTKYGIK